MKRPSEARLPSIAVAAVAFLSGCAQQPNVAPAAARNMAMIRAYVDAANRGDPTYLDQYLAPGYLYHGPGGELDADGFKAFHDRVLAAFPGLTFEIDDLIPTGDKVVTRWTLHGVQRGEFQGIAATGKEVSVTGIIITRFENGQAVEEWEEADLLGMMQQLGVLAPRGEGGDRRSISTPPVAEGDGTPPRGRDRRRS